MRYKFFFVSLNAFLSKNEKKKKIVSYNCQIETAAREIVVRRTNFCVCFV